MRKVICKILIRLAGWKVESEFPELKKCVIVGAPHTSNSDFYLSMLYFFSKGIKISFLIKKEAFFFPVAGMIRKAGGIPVDRGKKNNLIDQMKKMFKDHEYLYLLLAPEGTRRRVTHWKRGYYYIARAAEVPIVLAYLDYQKKTMGIGPVFFPSDDPEADLIKTKKFYQTIHPKFPEKFATGLE